MTPISFCIVCGVPKLIACIAAMHKCTILDAQARDDRHLPLGWPFIDLDWQVALKRRYAGSLIVLGPAFHIFGITGNTEPREF